MSVLVWLDGRNCVMVKLDEGTKGHDPCRVNSKKDMNAGLSYGVWLDEGTERCYCSKLDVSVASRMKEQDTTVKGKIAGKTSLFANGMDQQKDLRQVITVVGWMAGIRQQCSKL